MNTVEIEKKDGNIVVHVSPNDADLVGKIVEEAKKQGMNNIVVVDSVHDPMSDESNAIKEKLREDFVFELPHHRRAKVLPTVIAAASALGMGLPWGFAKGRSKKMEKCMMPGCGVMTSRDYCSAEHCREHRELRKLLRK